MDDLIGIAGAGRVARALGRLLCDAGQPVACIASRTFAHAREAAAALGPAVEPVSYGELPERAGRLLLSLPDDAIEDVAASIPATGGLALHTCGNRGAEALRSLARRGVRCGSLHPLQTIPDGPDGAASLRGIAFAIDGEAEAARWAESIAALAGGLVLRIEPARRPLYHAAAVMASNYIAAMLAASQDLMARAGVPPADALRAIGPLARTALHNALERGPAAALTGPIERGDAGSVAAHLLALTSAPAPISTLYRAAGLETLELARRRGLAAECASTLEHLLRQET